jgi:hypothetical protein
MECPTCGATITSRSGDEIRIDPDWCGCVLCGRFGAAVSKLVVGVHGGVCADCILLSYEGFFREGHSSNEKEQE